MLVFPVLCNSLPEDGGAEVILLDPTAGRCLPAEAQNRDISGA